MSKLRWLSEATCISSRTSPTGDAEEDGKWFLGLGLHMMLVIGRACSIGQAQRSRNVCDPFYEAWIFVPSFWLTYWLV